DHTMYVVSNSGVRLMPLLDALKAIDGRVIPAFYIRNRDVAVAVAGLLKGYGIRDSFIISRNQLAITDARTANSMMRGILEIDYDSAKPTLTDADLLVIRDKGNSSGAIGVLLPVQYTTKYNVEYLQHRLVSVYSQNYNQEVGTLYQSVLAGVQGLITVDIDELYDFYLLFPANSLIRNPLLIGHRGMPSRAPENTIEGSMLAYEQGAKVIELDIFLSLDNRIIVMHDATTTRTTNGTMTVEASTLAQLRTLTLLDNTGKFPNLKIPTLDDYFQAFKGLDVQIFIEIKSTKAEIVPVLRDLIEAYDFWDQSVVITFHTSQADNMRLHLPNISVGYLNTSLASAGNLTGSLLSIMNSVVPIKTTYNPQHTPLTPELLRELSYRGITTWPWTANTAADIYKLYTWGVGGITTDQTHIMGWDWVYLHMNQSLHTVTLTNPVSSIDLRGEIQTLNGLPYEYIPTFTLIDDGGTGIQISSNAVVTNFVNPGKAYIIVSFEATFLNGTTYRIYDDVVVINVRS
ncbi:MAG: glycerophosphodiester phosphodiesterase, partial [bacterium]|nr:glycerophosphodiester phosphodiesterase [bacterium]